MSHVEEYVRVLGHNLYVQRFAPEADRTAVLVLHGGPGASLDYLAPFEDLTRWGYPVVLFDQLGCGRSELPDGDELFTLDHHVGEVEGVLDALGLGPVHLIGSSYGGLLALAVAIRRPKLLVSLTTVGGLASVPFAQSEMDGLIRAMPEPHRGTLLEGARTGAIDSPAYLAATEAFYRRHLCRLVPWPAELERTLAVMAERPVYRIMNGPNEFSITGRIARIDLTPELGRIRLPALVLGGRYDEVTPAVAHQIARGVPGARSVTFEQSSHLPFWEEREAFFGEVARFLQDVDRRSAGGTAGGPDPG